MQVNASWGCEREKFGKVASRRVSCAYQLQSDVQQGVGDVGGYFTLLMKKVNGKWLVVRDHTS